MLTSTTSYGQDIGSISQGISGTLITSSDQEGFNSAIYQGADNVASAQIKAGILDPLGFLVDDTTMTARPATQANSMLNSLPDYSANSQLPPAQAGSGRSSKSDGAGENFQAGAVAAGASSSFTTAGLASSFSAGSAQNSRTRPSARGNRDATAPQGDSASMGSSIPDPTQTGVVLPDSGLSSTGLLNSDSSSMPGEGVLGVAPTGRTPGNPFPLENTVTASRVGFEDSTRGTAGSPQQTVPSSGGPFLRGDPSGSPFRAMNVTSDNFLLPTLHNLSSSTAGSQQAPSLHDLERMARKKAMLSGEPAEMMPDAAALRKLQSAAAVKIRQKDRTRRRAGSTVALDPRAQMGSTAVQP